VAVRQRTVRVLVVTDLYLRDENGNIINDENGNPITVTP
jgi:hypothetical protein